METLKNKYQDLNKACKSLGLKVNIPTLFFSLLFINFSNTYSICIKKITNISSLNLRIRKVDFDKQEHTSSEIANIPAAKLDWDGTITPTIIQKHIDIDRAALINYGLLKSEPRVEKPELNLKEFLKCDFIVYIQNNPHQEIVKSFRFYVIHNWHYDTYIFGVFENHFGRSYYDQVSYNFEIEKLIKDKEEDIELVFYLDNSSLKMKFIKYNINNLHENTIETTKHDN